MRTWYFAYSRNKMSSGATYVKSICNINWKHDFDKAINHLRLQLACQSTICLSTIHNMFLWGIKFSVMKLNMSTRQKRPKFNLSFLSKFLHKSIHINKKSFIYNNYLLKTLYCTLCKCMLRNK